MLHIVTAEPTRYGREDTVNDARVLASRIAATQNALDSLTAARVEAIRALRDVDVAWTEIGRIFGVSPQAAMYASGLVTRSSEKKRDKKGKPEGA